MGFQRRPTERRGRRTPRRREGFFAEALEPRQMLALTISSNVNSGGLDLTYEDAEFIVVSPNVQLNAGGGTIMMKAPVIRLSTGAIVTGGNVSLSGNTAIDLQGTSRLAVGGTLSLVADNGSVTQAAESVLTVAATATVAAGGTDLEGEIRLVGNRNDFIGAVSLTNARRNSISITDINALVLGNVSQLGDGRLDVRSNGNITQLGVINTGTNNAARFNAGDGAIILDNANNDFRGSVGLSNTGPYNIAINDINALNLAGVMMDNGLRSNGSVVVNTGTLRITSNGNIEGGGIRTGTGGAAINAGAGAIALGLNGLNWFRGPVTLTNTGANDIALANTGPNSGRLVVAGVNMDASAAGGLSLTTTTNITQTGPISTGTGAISLTTNGGPLTLTRADNDFRGVVDVTTLGSAFDAAITDANTLRLGNTNIAQDFTVRANAALTMGSGTIGRNFVAASNSAGGSVAVTQRGALTVRGTTSITAGAAEIALLGTGNDFVGAVNLTNTAFISIANDIAINDINALVLGNVSQLGDGRLDVRSNGNITQTGAINTGTGSVRINAGAGTIALENAGNNFRGFTTLTNTGANNIAVRTAGQLSLSGVSMTPTTAGALTINSASGVMQTGGTVVTGTGAATINAGAGAITLTSATNDFRGAVTLANTGANNIAITDINALALGGVSMSTLEIANLTVTANGAITQTGVINTARGITAINSGNGAITLTNAQNNFGGTQTYDTDGNRTNSIGQLRLANTGANDIAIDNHGEVVLSDVSMDGAAAGRLSVRTHGRNNQIRRSAGLNFVLWKIGEWITTFNEGSVTQTGPIETGTGGITIYADAGAITLNNASNIFRGAVNLTNTGTGWNTVLQRQNSGNPVVPQPVAPAVPSISLTTVESLALSGVTSVNGLTLRSNGNITQTGAAITVAGVTAINAGAGAITLNNGGNDFRGAVNLRNTGANNIAIRDIGALTLSGVTMDNAAGSLTLNTQGSILQTGAILTGTGSVTFDASNAASGAIILDNANNDFRGAVRLNNQGQGQNVSIRDVNALALSGITMSSINWGTTLTIVSNGILTQTGSISSNSGAVTINAGAGMIALSNGGNDFRGAVNLTNTGTNDIAIADSNALVLGGVNMTDFAAGRLSVAAGAGITQTGAINTGTGSGSINAGAGAMALENAGNNFRGFTTLTNTGANNIAVRTAGRLSLSGVSMTPTTAGALTINAASGVTQTGGTVVTGTGVSAFNAGNGAITLTNAGNSFGREVRFTNTGASNDVTINYSNALTLGTSATGGALNLTATSLQQTGAITAGNTTLAVSAAGGDINLSTQANNLGTVTIAGNAANVRDFNLRNTRAGVGAIVNLNDARITNLRDVSVQYDNAGYQIPSLTMASLRNVSFNAGAGLVQAMGGIRNSGTATFQANNTIALTDTFNNFGGEVRFTNTNPATSVTIQDSADLVLGTSSTGGALNLTAASMSQTGVITAGIPTLTVSVAGGDIDLSTQANNLGTVTIGGNAANVRDFKLHSMRGGSGVPVNLGNASNLRDLTLVLTGSSFQIPSLRMASLRNISFISNSNLAQAAGGIRNSGTANFESYSTSGGLGIGLTDAANDFGGAVSLRNSGLQGISIRTSGPLTLGNVNMVQTLPGAQVRTALNVTAGSSITQASGTTIVSGIAAVNMVAGAGEINLSNINNDFRAPVSLRNTGANNIAISTAGGLSLSGVSMTPTAGGSLSLTAGAGIHQIGALNEIGQRQPLSPVVTGTGAVAINAGAGVIDLNLVGNSFNGITRLTNTGANNIAIRTVGQLSLSGVSMTPTVAGALTINAGSGVNQTGGNVVTGMGAVMINAGAGGIGLDFVGNTFNGTTSLTNTGANNIAINDANGLTLGGVSMTATADGFLRITGHGNITQTGAISTGTGGSSLTAIGGAITLTRADNNFGGVVDVSTLGSSALDAAITDANALTLGNINIAQDLTVRANGALNLGSGTIGRNLVAASNNAGASGLVTQTNALTVQGTSNITATNEGIWLANAPNDFRGAVTLKSTGAIGISINDINALTLGGVAMTPTASARLRITSNGALTQMAGSTIVTGTGAVTIDTGAGAITLNNTGNNFAGPTSLTNTGANNITIRDVAALTLGAVSTSGNLSVQTNGALTQAQGTTILTGAGGSSFDAGAGAIALNNAGNDFSGSVSLINTGASNIAIRDINALNLAGVSGSGLTVNTGGAITQTGAIVTGSSASVFNASSGSITLTNASNNFGGSVALSVMGNGSVAIRDANSLVLSDVRVSPTNPGTFSVTTNGALTQVDGTRIITGAGAVTINSNAGAIRLNNASNFFAGPTSLTNTGTNNITIRDEGALVLSGVSMTPTAAGGLTVNTGGAITQTGAIVTGTGASAFNAGGSAITLDNGGNNFAGATSLSNAGANNITIRDQGALVLSGVSMAQTAAGGLTVNTGGAITQSGAIVTGTGASVFNAGANAITLNNAGNNFGGPTSLTNTGANNIIIRDAGALALSGVNMTPTSAGSLTVKSNGNITQTGVITTGTGSVTFNANAGAIRLDNAGNDFRGAVSLINTGASDIIIRESGDLQLDFVTMLPVALRQAPVPQIDMPLPPGQFNYGDGSLRVTTNGAITQTTGGEITVSSSGGAVFSAGAGEINLGNAMNYFGSAGSLSAVSLTNTGANNITIRDASGLTLGAVRTSGNLSVRTNGPLTQAQNTTILTGAGGSSFKAVNGAIALNNVGNDFSGSVSLTNTGANNIAIRDINALSLAGVSMTGGGLTVNTGGAITQSGAIVTGTGASVFNAGGTGAITLTNASNDFRGSVGLTTTGANDASITDSASLELGASNVAGNLNVTVGANGVSGNGNLTQNAAVTVQGVTNITAGARNTTINLTNPNNRFVRGVNPAPISNISRYSVTGTP